MPIIPKPLRTEPDDDYKPIPPPEICEQIAAELLAEMNMEEKWEAGIVTDEEYSAWKAARVADGDFRRLVKTPKDVRAFSFMDTLLALGDDYLDRELPTLVDTGTAEFIAQAARTL